MANDVTFSPLSGTRWALYDALVDIARQAQPKSYLEIGVSRGDSLTVVLENSTPERLALFDEWGSESGGQGLGGHDHIIQLLNRLSYHEEALFFDGSSHVLLPQFKKTWESCKGDLFDLILVDGDHSEEGARQDLYDVVGLLAPGGYVVFDDVAPDFFHPYLLGVWEDFCRETGVVEVYRELNDKFFPHTLSHGVVVGCNL